MSTDPTVLKVFKIKKITESIESELSFIQSEVNKISSWLKDISPGLSLSDSDKVLCTDKVNSMKNTADCRFFASHRIKYTGAVYGFSIFISSIFLVFISITDLVGWKYMLQKTNKVSEIVSFDITDIIQSFYSIFLICFGYFISSSNYPRASDKMHFSAIETSKIRRQLELCESKANLNKIIKDYDELLSKTDNHDEIDIYYIKLKDSIEKNGVLATKTTIYLSFLIRLVPIIFTIIIVISIQLTPIFLYFYNTLSISWKG